MFVLPTTPCEPFGVMNMIKNVLPNIYYGLKEYITFAEKFVTVVVTVAVFDYVNHAVSNMDNSVAATKMVI